MNQYTPFKLDPYVEELTQIVVKHLTTKHPSIAILAMYGSRARGDAIGTSDLEFFAVSDEKFDKFQFLFNGITVECGSHTWEDIEENAERKNYWIVPAGTIYVAKVVYSRTDEDLARYEHLRSELHRIHEDPKVIHMEEAEKQYQSMVHQLGRLQLARLYQDVNAAQDAVTGLMITYALFVSYINGRHLINNWGKNLDDLDIFPKRPKQGRELLEHMVVSTNIDRIITLATQFVDDCRKFLLGFAQPVEQPELEMLNDANGLEYLYKIEKSIQLLHQPALTYAIQDSHILYIQDMMKLDGKWTNFSHLLLFHEYDPEYRDAIPDLMQLRLSGDWQALRKGIEQTRDKILPIIRQQTELPSFTTIEGVRSYYL